MSKFDALALPVDAASRMIVKHPVSNQPLRGDDGKEAYIDLLSLDSQKAQAFDRTAGDRRLERLARGRSIPQSAEFEAEQTERMALLTTGWLLLGLDGTPVDVEFNEQNARELYAAPQMLWLRQQVFLFQGNLANFAKASSTT